METLLELEAVDGRPVVARLVRQGEHYRPSLKADRIPASDAEVPFSNQAGTAVFVELFDASRKDEMRADPWGLYVASFVVGLKVLLGNGALDPQIPWHAVANNGTLRLNRGPSKAKRRPVTLSAEAVADLDEWLCREQGLPPLRSLAFERLLDRPGVRPPRSRLSALSG
jgi:hypothetical protein